MATNGKRSTGNSGRGARTYGVKVRPARTRRGLLLGSSLSGGALMALIAFVGQAQPAWAAETLTAACAGNPPGSVYECHGPDSDPIEIDPTGSFSVNFGPGAPFVWTGSSSSAVTINAGGYNTVSPFIVFHAGSSIANTGGNGLYVTDVGTDRIDINAATSESEASVVGTTNGILVDGQYFNESGEGDDTFGDAITINNWGHVQGTAGNGIEVTHVDDVTINNLTYSSLIGSGGTAGLYVDGADQVTFNNEGGLTANLLTTGATITNVAHTGPGEAVDVYNTEGGVIAGATTGLAITNVYGGSDNNVFIDNYAELDHFAGEGDTNPVYVPGGLIAGKNGDGVYANDVGGYVRIDNTLTGVSGAGVTLSHLDPLVYGNSGLLHGALPNSDAFNSGIWGSESGIDVSESAQGLDVFNNAGRIAGTADDGIKAFNIDDELYVDNGEAYFKGAPSLAGGTIWGGVEGIEGQHLSAGESDYSAEIYNGGRTAEGAGGIIFGVQDGVFLKYLDGNALVSNQGGAIVGYQGEGVLIAEGSESAGIVYNAGNDGGDGVGYHEGHIVAGTIAVDMNMEFDGLWNSAGGVVIGEGSDAHPVIQFTSASGEGYDDIGIGGVVLNGGIMTSRSNPAFDSTSALPSVNTFPIGGESGPLGNTPDYYINTPKIVADTANIATYAMGNQTLGSIGNLDSYWQTSSDLLFAADGGATALVNGEKFTLLNESGLGSQAETLVPDGTIPTEDGVVSNAIMFGRVDMTGSSQYFDPTIGESGEWETIGPVLANFGKWFTANAGNEDGEGNIVGDDNGAIVNAGFIQTGFGGESGNDGRTYTTFETSSFYNGADGGVFAQALAGEGDSSQTFDGWISMVDGADNDETRIYTDNYYGVTGHSFLAVDADFNNMSESPGSDLLVVQGNVYGSTGVVVHKLNSDTNVDIQNDRYTVADVELNVANNCDNVSGWCEAGDAFFVDPHSNAYVNVGGTGYVQDGFYMWGIKEEGDPSFYFAPTWGTNAPLQASLISGLGAAGLDTAGVPEDNAYGNVVFGQDANGGADLPAPVVATAPAMAPPTNKQSILWGRVVGDWSSRSTSVYDPTSMITFDTGSSQDTYALQGGIEFRPNADGDGLRLGLYGGYLSTDINFSSYGASAKGSGGSIGGYASLYRGPWYIDGELKADFLGVTYTSPSITASTNATNLIAIVNTGYHWQTGASFVEPIGTVAFANTYVGDVTSGGATVHYDNGANLKAGLGVRIGTTLGTPGATQTQLDLLGRVWDQFGGPNTVTLTDGNPLDTTSFSDSIAGLSGEIVGRATIYSADRTKSGFASLGAEFGQSTSLTGKVGVKMGF